MPRNLLRWRNHLTKNLRKLVNLNPALKVKLSPFKLLLTNFVLKLIALKAQSKPKMERSTQ